MSPCNHVDAIAVSRYAGAYEACDMQRMFERARVAGALQNAMTEVVVAREAKYIFAEALELIRIQRAHIQLPCRAIVRAQIRIRAIDVRALEHARLRVHGGRAGAHAS